MDLLRLTHGRKGLTLNYRKVNRIKSHISLTIFIASASLCVVSHRDIASIVCVSKFLAVSRDTNSSNYVSHPCLYPSLRIRDRSQPYQFHALLTPSCKIPCVLNPYPIFVFCKETHMPIFRGRDIQVFENCPASAVSGKFGEHLEIRTLEAPFWRLISRIFETLGHMFSKISSESPRK